MNKVSIASGNDLLPFWCQANTWTNTGLLSIGLLKTNFNEIRIQNLSFQNFKKCFWKSHLPQWRPFCPGGDQIMILNQCREEAMNKYLENSNTFYHKKCNRCSNILKCSKLLLNRWEKYVAFTTSWGWCYIIWSKHESEAILSDATHFLMHCSYIICTNIWLRIWPALRVKQPHFKTFWAILLDQKVFLKWCQMVFHWHCFLQCNQDSTFCVCPFECETYFDQYTWYLTRGIFRLITMHSHAGEQLPFQTLPYVTPFSPIKPS